MEYEIYSPDKTTERLKAVCQKLVDQVNFRHTEQPSLKEVDDNR